MKTLAIIGAGFSGTVTAIQFLRRSPAGIRIVLINRSGTMARGLAYGTSSPQHLLNVPVGNMTALADEPHSFLHYCQTRLPAVSASSFVARKLYGDYLASLLNDAESNCRPDVTLLHRTAEVNRLRHDGEGAIIELTGGEILRADHVVLAFGHFLPTTPGCLAPAVASARYQRDPWAGTFELIERLKPVLLLGSGLTALDVALEVPGPIYMLSRRGLLPIPHRIQRGEAKVLDGFCERLLSMQPTVRNYLREIRRQVEISARDGTDWRDLLAALRACTPAIWSSLPEIERRRFLRHAQPYWDVHRHRVAPKSYQRFQEALASGRIRPIAGRIKAVESYDEGLRISIQPRGGNRVEQIEVAKIINCTGPNTDLRLVEERLIAQLREEGLVQPDSLGLGLHVDERLAVMDAEGTPSTWLSYIGPMLKADYWEATAVPELRQHAQSLAIRLASYFKSQLVPAG